MTRFIGFSEADLTANARKFAEKIKNIKLDYEYPGGLDLRPDSDFHNKLVTEILARAQHSRRKISSRFDHWEEVDRTLTAFIDLSTEEQKLKDDDNRRPIRVTVPETYATLETLLTYMTAAFLDSPVFRYDWQGPEDAVGTILMEMLVDQQVRRYDAALELHTMWRNGIAYNVGPMSLSYVQEMGSVTRDREVKGNMFSELAKSFLPSRSRTERVTEESVISEGNKILARDPYQYLPDPNVPVSKPQDGEFVGWIERDNLMGLLGEEVAGNGFFNVQYLRYLSNGKSALFKEVDKPREKKYGAGTDSTTRGTSNPIDVIYFCWELIPSQYSYGDQKLGDSEYPEKWFFALAGDSVIISAQKMEEDHSMFPVAACAPDFDGHSFISTSKLEVINGLQTTADWMFDSHVANVRKALNDMTVVDPQQIYMPDLRKPGPGKIIRTRRAAWGRGLRDAIMQFPVVDVTRGHMGDVANVRQMMRDVSSAADSLQGIRRERGERVSATEARDVQTGALSRLEKAARIIYLQSHKPLAFMMARNTSQFLSEETYAKVVGDWEKTLLDEYGIKVDRDRVAIKPSDLDVMYDIKEHDGSIPNAGDAGLWTDLFQTIGGSEILMQVFDIVRVFKHVARIAGAKNLNDFMRKGGNLDINVVPDGEVGTNGDTVPVEQAELS